MKALLITILLISISFIGWQIYAHNSATNSTGKTGHINDLGIIHSKDLEDAKSKLSGKPSIVFIVGTFCPHCQAAMPKYKTDLFDVYKDKINIFANVTDGASGKRFDVEGIPQGVDEQLSFKNLTGEECNYVPSWIILDAKGKTIDSSCGSQKGIDVIKNNIDNLLQKQSNTTSTTTTE